MRTFERLRLGLYSVMFAALALTCGSILTTPADAAPPDIGIGCTYTDAGTASTKACIGIYAGGATDSNGLSIQGNVVHDLPDVVSGVVEIGGYASGPAPASVQTGDRVRAWFSTFGGQSVFITDVGGNSATLTNYTTDALSITQQALRVGAFGYYFDGTTAVRARGDQNGAVNQPYATGNFQWTYAGASGPTIVASTVAVPITTASVGLRGCLTGMQIETDALATASDFVITDGASVVLWRGRLQAGVNNIDLDFAIPLKASALNSAISVRTLTNTGTGFGVYVNAQGFNTTL